MFNYRWIKTCCGPKESNVWVRSLFLTIRKAYTATIELVHEQYWPPLECILMIMMVNFLTAWLLQLFPLTTVYMRNFYVAEGGKNQICPKSRWTHISKSKSPSSSFREVLEAQVSHELLSEVRKSLSRSHPCLCCTYCDLLRTSSSCYNHTMTVVLYNAPIVW